MCSSTDSQCSLNTTAPMGAILLSLKVAFSIQLPLVAQKWCVSKAQRILTLYAPINVFLYNCMPLFWLVHSEPHRMTRVVNYIMPFNSSTDYYQLQRRDCKKDITGISQMRRLSSDWGRAFNPNLRNRRRQLNSALSKSHIRSFYVRFIHSIVTEKKKILCSLVLKDRGKRCPFPSPPPNKPNTRYIQDDYLHYSQMIQTAPSK